MQSTEFKKLLDAIPGRPGTKKYEVRVKAIALLHRLLDDGRFPYAYITIQYEKREFPTILLRHAAKIESILVTKEYFGFMSHILDMKFDWKDLQRVVRNTLTFKRCKHVYTVHFQTR